MLRRRADGQPERLSVRVVNRKTQLFPTPGTMQRSMKTITLLALSALALAACDSKQEQLRKAELENRADRLEDAAKATKKAADGDAEVVKKQGEAKAEALKEAADKTRDQK